MFENKLVGATQATIPGAGPQLPNDNDRGRVHYIWEIYDPDTVKPGEAYRYVVPREKEVVLDTIGQVVYRVDHVNWESDLRSKLVAIYNTGNSGSGDDPISSIFGLPGGFQGEGVVGIDYSVRPNRAVIDGQIMAPNAAYALLYEGNIVGESGKVISVMYGSNQQLISNRVPVGLAAIHELTNKEIMVTQPFSVNRSAEELPDGSMCTLVWYDHAGNMIPKARMLSVQHTALLRDHQVGKRYIKNVELIAPWFMNSGDPKTLHVPVNTMLQNLAFRAVVHYSDGSKSDELPIDGNKVQLLGLNEHKPSSPGQRGTLTLVYNLDTDESIYEAQPGSPNQYRSSYWLLSTAFDGAYSPRLFTYPTWVSGQYVLKHFLTDLNRSFMIDVTNHVRINELSPAFRPTSYGVEQSLDLNLRLSDAVPTFEPMIMRQSVTVVLKTAGGNAGSKFDVRYSYDQRSYVDPTFRAVNQSDNRQELTFGKPYASVEAFLDDLYYAAEPAYNVQREKGPMVPTHFELITPNGRIYEYEVGQYAERMHLETQEPQGQAIYIRWIYQPLQGDRLILAMSAASIDVKQGGNVTPPKATTIVLDDSMVKEIPEWTPFTVKGRVYDQYGQPYLGADTGIMMQGGAYGGRSFITDVAGNFEFYTYSTSDRGVTTLKFGFDKGAETEFVVEHEINNLPYSSGITYTFDRYNPRKAKGDTDVLMYGKATKDGQPVPNLVFFSSISLDPKTIQVETTDAEGNFVIERGRMKNEFVSTFQIVTKNNPSWTVQWVTDGSSFGDRIVADKDVWEFEEGRPFEFTGRTYDQNGDLAAGIPVSVFIGPNWQMTGSGTSASNGIYTAQGSPRPVGTDYDFILAIDNAHVAVKARWVKPVLVPTSVVLDSNNVTKAETGTPVSIKAKVVDQKGGDVSEKANIPVDYVDPDGKASTIYADPLGNIDMPVGIYPAGKVTTFQFGVNGGPKVTQTITWTAVVLKPTSIEWAEGSKTSADVGGLVQLYGTVKDQNGDTYTKPNSTQVVVSDGTNTENFLIYGSGTIQHNIVGKPVGDYHFTYTVNGKEIGSYDFTVCEPGTVEILAMSTTDPIVGESGDIYVYVKEADGKPSKGAVVEGFFNSVSGEAPITATSDEEGIAIFKVPQKGTSTRMTFFARFRSVKAQTAINWGKTTGGYEFTNVDFTDNIYSDIPSKVSAKLLDEFDKPRANAQINFFDLTDKVKLDSVSGTNVNGEFTVDVGPLSPGKHRIFMYTRSAKHEVQPTWLTTPDPSRRLSELTFDDGLPDPVKVGTKVTLKGDLKDQHGVLLDDGEVITIPVTIYLGSGDKKVEAKGTGDGHWTLELDVTEAGSWYMEFYHNGNYLTDHEFTANP